MLPIAEALKAYTHSHPFDPGTGDDETVLDQLYRAYCDSHESDPPEITSGFKELGVFLESLAEFAVRRRHLHCPKAPKELFDRLKRLYPPGYSRFQVILPPGGSWRPGR